MTQPISGSRQTEWRGQRIKANLNSNDNDSDDSYDDDDLPQEMEILEADTYKNRDEYVWD